MFQTGSSKTRWVGKMLTLVISLIILVFVIKAVNNRPINPEYIDTDDNGNVIENITISDLFGLNGEENTTIIDKIEEAGFGDVKDAVKDYTNGNLRDAQNKMSVVISNFLDTTILTNAFGVEIDETKIQQITNEDGTITTIVPDEYKMDGHIMVVNVGLGNCTIIESKGEAMLIDSGEYSEQNYQVLASALNFWNIKSLKYIVGSHPHDDHIGMLSSIISTYQCEKLIVPNCKSDNLYYNAMLSKANMYGIEVVNPDIGDTFSFGDVTVTVVSPSKNAKYENINDYSLCLLADVAGIKYFCSGDATFIVEQEILERETDIKADILLVPHHGSFASSYKEFVEKIDAETAIISVGENEYNFPNQITKDTYASLGFELITNQMTTEERAEIEKPLYRTDTTGGLYVYIKDGKYHAIMDKDLIEMLGLSTEESAKENDNQ